MGRAYMRFENEPLEVCTLQHPNSFAASTRGTRRTLNVQYMVTEKSLHKIRTMNACPATTTIAKTVIRSALDAVILRS